MPPSPAIRLFIHLHTYVVFIQYFIALSLQPRLGCSACWQRGTCKCKKNDVLCWHGRSWYPHPPIEQKQAIRTNSCGLRVNLFLLLPAVDSSLSLLPPTILSFLSNLSQTVFFFSFTFLSLLLPLQRKLPLIWCAELRLTAWSRHLSYYKVLTMSGASLSPGYLETYTGRRSCC